MDLRDYRVPMLIALVAMNYHFVSDVIAGSVLGAVVSAWATRLFLQAFGTLITSY